MDVVARPPRTSRLLVDRRPRPAVTAAADEVGTATPEQAIARIVRTADGYGDAGVYRPTAGGADGTVRYVNRSAGAVLELGPAPAGGWRVRSASHPCTLP